MNATTITRWGLGWITISAIILGTVSDTPPDSERGREIFDTVCTVCHSMQPPARLAPPMMMVAMHYEQAHDGAENQVAAVVTWLERPSADRSALGDHAIEKFGLMPPVKLSEDDARSVAQYIFETYRAGADTESGASDDAAPGRMRRMRSQDGASEGHSRPMLHSGTEAGEGHSCSMHSDGEAGAEHSCPMHSDGEAGAEHSCPMHSDGEAGAEHSCPMHQKNEEGAEKEHQHRMRH